MKPIIRISCPKILFHRKTEDGIECGPLISNLDTGIYYCRYDYGKIFKVVILGFGIDILWTNI